MLQNPVLRDTLLDGFRLLGIWDMAPLQEALAGMALRNGIVLEPHLRGHLHQGRGLALIGLGRVAEGLMHIDSAATLFDADSCRLEAAEWRIVAPALGLPGVAPAERESGRSMLHALVGDSATRARAAWALGLDAAAATNATSLRIPGPKRRASGIGRRNRDPSRRAGS